MCVWVHIHVASCTVHYLTLLYTTCCVVYIIKASSIPVIACVYIYITASGNVLAGH